MHVGATLVVARVGQRTQGAHKGRPYGPITYQTDTGSHISVVVVARLLNHRYSAGTSTGQF